MFCTQVYSSTQMRYPSHYVKVKFVVLNHQYRKKRQLSWSWKTRALITHVTPRTQSFQLELIMKLINSHVAEPMNRDDAWHCSQTLVPLSTFTFPAIIIMRHNVRTARTGRWSCGTWVCTARDTCYVTNMPPQDCTNLPKSRSHFRILGARRKFRVEDRQLLGAKMYTWP